MMRSAAQTQPNSAKGRMKDRNMRRDPRVSLTVMDPDNQYRYVEIRGRVAEITENGADTHIDKMAKKYLDKDNIHSGSLAKCGSCIRSCRSIRSRTDNGSGRLTANRSLLTILLSFGARVSPPRLPSHPIPNQIAF